MNYNQKKLEKLRESLKNDKDLRDKLVFSDTLILEALEEKIERIDNKPTLLSNTKHDEIKFNEPLWFREKGKISYSVGIPEIVILKTKQAESVEEVGFTDGNWITTAGGTEYELFKYKPEITDEVELK